MAEARLAHPSVASPPAWSFGKRTPNNTSVDSPGPGAYFTLSTKPKRKRKKLRRGRHSMSHINWPKPVSPAFTFGSRKQPPGIGYNVGPGEYNLKLSTLTAGTTFGTAK